MKTLVIKLVSLELILADVNSSYKANRHLVPDQQVFRTGAEPFFSDPEMAFFFLW